MENYTAMRRWNPVIFNNMDRFRDYWSIKPDREKHCEFTCKCYMRNPATTAKNMNWIKQK